MAKNNLLEKSVHPHHTSGLGLRLRGETETVLRQESPCKKGAVGSGYQGNWQILSSLERG